MVTLLLCGVHQGLGLEQHRLEYCFLALQNFWVLLFLQMEGLLQIKTIFRLITFIFG